MTLSRNAQRAIAKHGLEACKMAHFQNTVNGEGANTIANTLPVATIKTTRQADAAINAYAEYLSNSEARS